MCVLLTSKTSVLMLGTLPLQLLVFALRCTVVSLRRVEYGRCMVSRGVWRLSGSWCGAFGDAIVCVNAATTFKYIIGGLTGWTMCRYKHQ